MTQEKDAGQKSKIVEVLEYYAGLSVDDLRKFLNIRQAPFTRKATSEWEMNDDQISTVKRILTRIASDY